MSRADILEEERRDFFAYVDEFYNFATEAFASIFSEARKYHLALTVPPAWRRGDEQIAEIVRRTSRHRYGRFAIQVERELAAILA